MTCKHFIVFSGGAGERESGPDMEKGSGRIDLTPCF
jgi:hypothetical protein